MVCPTKRVVGKECKDAGRVCISITKGLSYVALCSGHGHVRLETNAVYRHNYLAPNAQGHQAKGGAGVLIKF